MPIRRSWSAASRNVEVASRDIINPPRGSVVGTALMTALAVGLGW
jgi:hypothetical protein